MNFAQELFVLCTLGFITISTVILNQRYITSSAKYNIDNSYLPTRRELIFMLAVYASRFVVGFIIVVFAGVCAKLLFSCFWAWLGTL